DSGCGASGRAAGVRAAQTAMPSEAAATAPNVARVPPTEATPPSTGPSSAPVQENALASPCANRARSSCQASVPNPNSAVVAATTVRPIRTVGLTPNRAAAIPLGIEPASAPTGYAAAS